MRKITSLLIVILFAFSLSGCSFGAIDTEKGLEFLISSIGFDRENGEFSVFLETVTVNSEDADSDKKLTLINGSGKNLAEAFKDANQKSVRPFMFSHCAVAVIGKGVSEKDFRNICTFLYEKDEINLSLRFIYTDNAKKLLSSETVASIAVGYDITDAIDRQSDYSGIVYKNRFYEVEAARREVINVFALPRFAVIEKGYTNEGITVFKNDQPIMNLDPEQAFVYSLVTESQKKGEVLLNNKTFTLKKTKLKQKFQFENRLSISLSLDITLEGDGNMNSRIADTINELFITSKKEGADIFMFGNQILRTAPKAWQKIEHNYPTVYKNSRLAVTVK